MRRRKFGILYLADTNPAAEGMLTAVWHKIMLERLNGRLFHDGSVTNGEGFVAEVLRGGSLPFVVLCDGEIAACSWLNSINGRMARTHFVIFRNFWGREIHQSLGRNFYSYVLTRKDGKGHMFDCLFGITPISNRLAWRAALDCGWQKIGEIPNACYMAAKGQSEAGIITCATREILAIEDGREWSARWEL